MIQRKTFNFYLVSSMSGNNMGKGGFSKTRRSMQQSHTLLGPAFYIPFLNHLTYIELYVWREQWK